MTLDTWAKPRQAEILREKYRILREHGALDIRFCFAPLAEETVESVCGSINEALDAIERGEYEELPPFGDSHRTRGVALQ
jgi:hypothetical protein